MTQFTITAGMYSAALMNAMDCHTRDRLIDFDYAGYLGQLEVVAKLAQVMVHAHSYLFEVLGREVDDPPTYVLPRRLIGVLETDAIKRIDEKVNVEDVYRAFLITYLPYLEHAPEILTKFREWLEAADADAQ